MPCTISLLSDTLAIRSIPTLGNPEIASAMRLERGRYTAPVGTSAGPEWSHSEILARANLCRDNGREWWSLYQGGRWVADVPTGDDAASWITFLAITFLAHEAGERAREVPTHAPERTGVAWN